MASKLKASIFTPNDPTAPRVCPALACEIGLNESMLLLQLEFWIRLSGKLQEDGRFWIYESLADFREIFPFWSAATINRAVHSLQKQELIYVGNYNKLKFDRTRWFALNGKGLAKLKSVHVVTDWALGDDTSISQNDTPSAQNDTTIPDLSSDLSPSENQDAPSGAVSTEEERKADIASFFDGDVPEPTIAKEPTIEKKDAVLDIVQQASRRESDPLWWLRPGTACGDHDYLEPYRAFCAVIGRDPSTVGQGKTQQWLDRFATIAAVSPAENGSKAVVIQPDIMARAIKVIRGDWNFEHRRWTTPFNTAFADLVELTAAQIETGQLGGTAPSSCDALAKAGYDVEAIKEWAQKQAQTP